MVARHRDHRPLEREQQSARALVLGAAAAVREVAGRDDELGRDPVDECRQRLLDLRVLVCTRVEIGNMQDPCGHERMRL